MNIWGHINRVSNAMYLVIVLLMLMLAVIGILMFFANATGYYPAGLSADKFADKFKHLLGDVLLLMVILELSKTVVIYVTQQEFYLQGIVTAVLIATCRGIIFIKFESPTAVFSAAAAAIVILALLIVLKYAPTRLESPLPKNICEMNVTMKDRSGALASVAGVIAKHNGNIISGRIVPIGDDKSVWAGLVDITRSDVDLIKGELMKNEFVEGVEVNLEES